MPLMKLGSNKSNYCLEKDSTSLCKPLSLFVAVPALNHAVFGDVFQKPKRNAHWHQIVSSDHASNGIPKIV